MCEQDDFSEFARRSGLTRRQFGAMALGATLAANLPKLAHAADTKGADVEIKTADGTADAYFVHPAKGQHPAVLIWPDIFGLRPAFKEMATRLAGSGYAVHRPLWFSTTPTTSSTVAICARWRASRPRARR